LANDAEISIKKTKQNVLNDLIKQLDKTGSDSSHRFICVNTGKHWGGLTRRSTSGWTTFCWSLELKQCILNIFCTKTLFPGLC